MSGVLNGIGVGVGDPEMLTIKAVNNIKGSDVICLPRKDKTRCRAYQIVASVIPEICQKQIVCFEFEMTSDKDVLKTRHREIYKSVKEYLIKGKTVSFLTIGDPTVYSTFSYIAEQAQKDHVKVQIINGINSFCACAARLGISLCEGDSPLHIISGTEDFEKELALTGTKILMKCSGALPAIKKTLSGLVQERQTRGISVAVYAVSDCGTDQEKRYYGIDQLPEESGYMMTVIVTEKRLEDRESTYPENLISQNQAVEGQII